MSNGVRLRTWFFSGGVGAALLLGAMVERAPADSASAPIPNYQPVPGEFDASGQAVLHLLQSGDAAAFAQALAISAEDWRSRITTNLPKAEAEQFERYASNAGHNRERLETAAKEVLSRSGALHVDFARGVWRCEVAPPPNIGRIFWTESRTEEASDPYLQELELLVVPEGSSASNRPAGDFKLALRGLDKFPSGWRADSVQWLAFPTNVVDLKTARELAILAKVADAKGWDAQDDPGLLTLGEALARFLRQHDTNAFQRDLLMDGEAMWNKLQKDGRTGPTRSEVDEEMAKEDQEQLQSALAVAKVIDDAGANFQDADIKIQSASVQRGSFSGAGGSLDDVFGAGYRLVLSVKTDAKAKNGASLAGEYVLAVKSLMHDGGQWKISGGFRWAKLPPGIVDDETASRVEFENYVAEHGTLPPHSRAPEIEFTTLDGAKRMKLSDLRGRVVILDFWATWCGPCQAPMAELQKLREGHGDWGDHVAIVPLSIDDTIDTVRQHVNQRGWTNTLNVWAGDGGWHSKPATTFRVTGVPTSYVIDQEGKIIWAGHPATASFVELVDTALGR